MRNTHNSDDAVRLVHLADVHLGFQTPLPVSEGIAAGRPQREVDIERALDRLTRSILAANPPVDLVVVAGDLFHFNTPRPFAIAAAARFVYRLTSRSESAIDVVIIDGNHDSPTRRTAGSPLTFLTQLGAHVVNADDYRVLRDNWQNPRLHGRLIAHCLPYSAVTNGDFAGVRPAAGAINVLVAHGRIGGMEEVNSLHRTVAWIPKDVLRRGWDYGALGDWHQHGYRPLTDAYAYYPGTLEALNFGEASDYPPRKSDPNAVHGALDVRLHAPGAEPEVQTLPNDEARPVLRLQPIDAKGLDADKLMNQIQKRLDENIPKKALALLKISNCDHTAWNDLDHQELAVLRSRIRLCDIRPEFVHHEAGQSTEEFQDASVADQWRNYLEQKEPDETFREVLYAKGLDRIEEAQRAVRGQLADTGVD